MASSDSWLNHFPGNLKWSNATLVCKGMAPYGAVALQEIDMIGARLNQRANEPHAWEEEWCAMAAKLEAVADEAVREGRDFTAGNYYLRAGNYYYTGERMVPPGEEKLDIYKKALRCYQAGLRRRYSNLEFVEVPFEGKSLPAYFLKGEGVTGPAPTVVLFDGMDNCKEMSVLFAGLEFAKRGINTLAIDGPGQGEALRLRKIYARHDYEVAGTAAYEYVAGRPDVDPGKVVVMGYSMGGYYAPRVAAFEKRYAACVALAGMPLSLYERQLAIKQRFDASPKDSAQSNFQLLFILGISDWTEALERIKLFTIKYVVDQISCPFLVVHGDNDRVTNVSFAHELYSAVGSKDKTLKIFSVEEGAAEHCQVDNRMVGIDYVADWISKTLK